MIIFIIIIIANTLCSSLSSTAMQRVALTFKLSMKNIYLVIKNETYLAVFCMISLG